MCAPMCFLVFLACRLPGSDLLLGLPVVLDSNNDNIREGQRVGVCMAECALLQQQLPHVCNFPFFSKSAPAAAFLQQQDAISAGGVLNAGDQFGFEASSLGAEALSVLLHAACRCC